MAALRKWIAAHRNFVRAVVFAVICFSQIALYVSFGNTLQQAILSSVLWSGIMAAIWYVGARRQRRMTARLDAEDAILVYVRYPDARPGSLSGIWEMGVATFVGAGTIKFQPAANDTLDPIGRPTTFSAVMARVAERRELSRKESRYVPTMGFRAIRLTTDKGDIEVAGRPESLRRILDAIRQEDQAP